MKYIIKPAVLEYQLQYKHCVVVQKHNALSSTSSIAYGDITDVRLSAPHSVAALIQCTSHHTNISLLFSPNGFSQSLYFFQVLRKKKLCKVES